MCLERSLELVVALLAVLKAGRPICRSIRSYPAERGSPSCWRTARAPVAAHRSRALLDRLPAFGTAVHRASTGRRSPLGRTSRPMWRVCPDDLAYVIYTSGSTGEPEGRCGRASGVNLCWHWAMAHARSAPSDRVARSPPIRPLTRRSSSCGRRCSRRRGGSDRPTAALGSRAFGRTLKRHCVDALWLTAGSVTATRRRSAEELSRSRDLLVGGEALDPQRLERCSGARRRAICSTTTARPRPHRRGDL